MRPRPRNHIRRAGQTGAVNREVINEEIVNACLAHLLRDHGIAAHAEGGSPDTTSYVRAALQTGAAGLLRRSEDPVVAIRAQRAGQVDPRAAVQAGADGERVALHTEGMSRRRRTLATVDAVGGDGGAFPPLAALAPRLPCLMTVNFLSALGHGLPSLLRSGATAGNPESRGGDTAYSPPGPSRWQRRISGLPFPGRTQCRRPAGGRFCESSSILLQYRGFRPYAVRFLARETPTVDYGLSSSEPGC